MKKEFKGNSNKPGKGSNRRPEDPKKVRINWDGIKGFGKSKYK